MEENNHRNGELTPQQQEAIRKINEHFDQHEKLLKKQRAFTDAAFMKFKDKAALHGRSLEPWDTHTLEFLFIRLQEEVEELKMALITDNVKSTEAVQDECKDIANFAWFISEHFNDYLTPSQ